MLGRGGALTFPDQHKLTEGLFLSAWTQWEEFIRRLLIEDLADDPQGLVKREVSKFRTSGAPRRIAERVLFHPDHPNRFVEWDVGLVRSRANTFLSAHHRFSVQLPRETDLEKLARIRNAIAHRSDKAWASFRKLVADPPFLMTPQQCKGLTVGRFLCATQWNGNPALNESLTIHRVNAQALVP
jgi:predicted neuraminidase